jgi:hypothetical protein
MAMERWYQPDTAPTCRARGGEVPHIARPYQPRAALLDAVSDDIWDSARNGFGDPDLADQ